MMSDRGTPEKKVRKNIYTTITCALVVTLLSGDTAGFFEFMKNLGGSFPR